jgi:hypothetical protein
MVSATGVQCTYMATATVFVMHNVKCVSCACVLCGCLRRSRKRRKKDRNMVVVYMSCQTGIYRCLCRFAILESVDVCTSYKNLCSNDVSCSR